MGGRGEDRRAKSQRSLRATERPDLKKKKPPLGNLRKRANMIKLCVRSSLTLVWGTDWRNTAMGAVRREAGQRLQRKDARHQGPECWQEQWEKGKHYSEDRTNRL